MSPSGAGAMHLSSAIKTIVTLIDDRQPGYQRHANNVARLTRMVGLQFDLDPTTLENLRLAALLHDAGSLRLPFSHVGSRWRLPPEGPLLGVIAVSFITSLICSGLNPRSFATFCGNFALGWWKTAQV